MNVNHAVFFGKKYFLIKILYDGEMELSTNICIIQESDMYYTKKNVYKTHTHTHTHTK